MSISYKPPECIWVQKGEHVMGLFDKLRRRKKEKVQSSVDAPQTDYSQTIVGFVLLEREDCDFNLLSTG